MTQALTLRAYARWRKAKGLPGQSHTAVRRAIESGRLRAALRQTDTGRTLIDPEKADEEWARNTDVAQTREPPPERPPEDGQGDLFPGASTKVPDAPRDGRPAAPALARSQAVNALFRARLTQLEYEEKSGKLCSAAEVAAEAFTLGRAVRDSLLLIPDRISPQLAAETSATEIHELLTREITEALELLTGRPDGTAAAAPASGA